MVGGTRSVTDRAAGEARRGEMRALLERTLRELDADEARGPKLHATGLRLRLELTDSGLVLDVAASDDPRRHLQWTFDGDADWEPTLVLAMDSETANRYLQGRESLAIGIARRRVRCRGDSRAAMAFLPSVRLIAEPYRRLVAASYPHLALG